MAARLRRYASELGWPIGISLAMLALWEFAVRELGIRSIILPPPSEIAQAIIARHDLLLTHLWPSLYLTVVGFALSVVGGVLVAVADHLFDHHAKGVLSGDHRLAGDPEDLDRALVHRVVRDRHDVGLLLAFLVSFFPMTINAAMGFQAVDEDIHRMARTFMGTRWQIFWKSGMPNALPYIFAGMKISITLAIIGVIVSEFVASQEGIGYLIKLAGGLLDTPLMMAAITVLSISGLALYGVIAAAEGRAVYWQTPNDIGGAAGG